MQTIKNSTMTFKEEILAGIPNELPQTKTYDPQVNHAPKRKKILSPEEEILAYRNALRYFDPKHHATLLPEFKHELETYGRIYMHRFRPDYKIYARPIQEYPGESTQAKAIMLMIQNNLDHAVAQHPDELITYGGNGGVFSNWAQYRLVMQYLAQMTDQQTLAIYSGHPMGLFPSHKDAPRVVVTNGMMIPNYSKADDWEKFNALGVTQYGQMTAGSYMYIGPQGIVHGTTITVLNGFRKIKKSPKGGLFVTSGLGGMSGAQPKAGNIAGCVTVCGEINKKATKTRHEQGWVDEVISDLDQLGKRVKEALAAKQAVSIAWDGNIVDVWEHFDKENIHIDLGSDQTSLHNPWAGGYYPMGLSYEQSNEMMANDPALFKEKIQETLKRHVAAINKHTAKGTYFFDYGNAFLLEASRAGANIMAENNIDFKYSSYVQARILYADSEGRMKIASAFNKAIKEGHLDTIILGRDHHDVSGTDSPYRETSNIYDGSRFTADMAIQNVIGDSFRGATWVSIHNGGGVGWGEVINGGFGMVLDGSNDAQRRLESMLFWDVNNGIARRSWARNKEAVFAIKREMKRNPNLKVTLPNFVDDSLLN